MCKRVLKTDVKEMRPHTSTNVQNNFNLILCGLFKFISDGLTLKCPILTMVVMVLRVRSLTTLGMVNETLFNHGGGAAV